MSIIVNLYYTGKTGSARRFAEEMIATGLVEAVRAEEGNERYEYFFPMEDPETVLLIDRWRDQAALDFHHHTEMMEKMSVELREEAANMMKIDDNVTKVAEIVDNNSATSEETAAVSEEQTAQVATMVQMMEQFTI